MLRCIMLIQVPSLIWLVIIIFITRARACNISSAILIIGLPLVLQLDSLDTLEEVIVFAEHVFRL